MQAIRCILVTFEAVSWLRINLEKSKLFGVGVIFNEKMAI